jgi:glyoxylase-like metal-dependent hydrolase (beta-lactamase superfamily II)
MKSVTTLDLRFSGITSVIAAYLAPTPDGGAVLLETGPGSTVEILRRAVADTGYTVSDLRGICVTHVHLDHAGAAGEIAAEAGCPVWAHPRGTTHLADPSRLLASAERLYGDRLVPLWGAMAPVPGELLRPAEDGQVIDAGGLEIRAWHTPGHAVHHVAWQVGSDVVVGDVGGIRFPGADRVLPPTPPPDIDLAAWDRSLDRLRGLGARRLLLSHFGAFDDVDRHLEELSLRLHRWGELALANARSGGGREQLTEALDEDTRRENDLRPLGDEATAQRYGHLCPTRENSAGLARWAAAQAG